MSDDLHCDRHELLVALQPQEIKLIARPFEFSETGGLFLSWARSPSLLPACSGPGANRGPPSDRKL